MQIKKPARKLLCKSTEINEMPLKNIKTINNMKTTNNNQSMTEKTPRHKKNDTNCFSVVLQYRQQSVQLHAAVTVTIDHAVGGRTIV